MKAIISSIFKTFFLSLCVIANTHFVYAQTAASILPQAKTQLLDNNGKPLVSGTVDYYVPGTTTRKTTWQDSGKTIPNTNPVVLDGGGRALMLGDGSYRQVVKDRLGNIIWDQVTSSTGSGGGGGGSATVGDGQPVGSIQLWGGFIAPNQYAFAYGQEFSRVSFPELLQAITLSQSVTCTLGSPTINASNTSQIPIGAPIESTCFNAGSTVISKTVSTITVSSNAVISSNTSATIFPYGNGDGVNTYNLPDYRGKAPVGRCNMGDISCTNLNSTYYGANPNALGANGGSQSQTLTAAQIPPLATTGILANSVSNSSVSGGVFGGSGQTTLSVTGGAQPSITGNPAISVFTATTTTISGTINSTGGAAHSLIQPSITANYVIKTMPDTNPNSYFGVASLGGMTGVITCGSGVTCAGNTISAVGGGGGSTPAWDNTGLSITSAYSVNIVDTTKTITASGNAAYNITFGDPTTFPAKFNVMVTNADDNQPKTIVLNGQGNFILEPKQSTFVYLQNSKWFVNISGELINVKDFGAKGDAKVAGSAGSMSSGSATLTMSGNYFVATDVGKQIDVTGAGVAGASLHTTIATYVSPTQVNLNVAASTTVSTTTVQWGTDDHNAIQAAITYANAQQVSFQPVLPLIGSFIQSSGTIQFPRGNYYSSAANMLGQITNISAYGAVFTAPAAFTSGNAYFQALATCGTGPFNGRYTFMRGGTFSNMSSHFNVYNCNVGGNNVFYDTVFNGATDSSVTMQAESSFITFINTVHQQNRFTYSTYNRVAGGISQTSFLYASIVTPGASGTEWYNFLVDGCSINGTACGGGTQASADVLTIRDSLLTPLPATGTPVDPAYIKFKDGGRLILDSNRFGGETGSVAIVNNYTKFRVPNLSTNVDPLVQIVLNNNEVAGADATIANDKNSGIRLFAIPNIVVFRDNYGHAATGPVLAPGTGATMAGMLSGATQNFVSLEFSGNKFPNNVTTNEYLLIPSLYRGYLAPFNAGVINSSNGINLFGSISGSASIIAPSTASGIMTMPTNSGTAAVTASAPLVLNSTTGNLTCPTCTSNIVPNPGNSGGVPYYNTTTSMLSSNTLAANGVVVGGGAGGAPATTGVGTAGQLFIGQAGTPLFQTVTGDWTINASGVSTLATVNSNVGSFGSASAVPTFTVDGKGRLTAAGSVAYQNGSNSVKGVVQCDGTTINCSSGVITAVGAAASSIGVGTTTVSGGTSPYILYNNGGTLGNIQIVPTANGGTGNTGGAFTAWTPTVTAAAGTPTSVSATGSYQQIGKLVTAIINITVTNAGTASADMLVPVPVGTPIRRSVGTCVEANNTGTSGWAQILTGGSIFIRDYKNATFWANGNLVSCQLTYEAT